MTPHLHLFCGLPASGKSTYAAQLAAQPGTVLIAEDAWLAALYGDQMSTLADYVCCSALLEAAMAPHVEALLRAGLSVVLDFQGNTLARRAWMRGIVDRAGVAHRLHWVDVPDRVCKARLAARTARGDHPFAVSEAQFDRVARHFLPPTSAEGLHITRHRPG